jgi:FKBP-type peptidyl-prolyl cis-trans isomerase (trigger factor)
MLKKMLEVGPDTSVSFGELNDSEFNFSVSVDGTKLKEALERSWQGFSKQLIEESKSKQSAKYRGFRNIGKIPYDLVAGDFKERFKVPFVEAVALNARDASVSEVIQAFLNERGLKADDIEYRVIEKYDWKLDGELLSMELDQAKDAAHIKYELYIETSPQLKPLELEKLSVDLLEVCVTEKDAEDDLKLWAKSNKRGVPCEPRAAKNGDIVVIDLTINAPGGSVNKKDFLVELGSPVFAPEFQAQFLEKSAGDHVSYKFEVPAGIGGREFEGKSINASAVVKRVMDAAPYEYNEELARALKYSDLEDAVEKRKLQLQHRAGELVLFLASSQIEQALADKYEVKVSEKRFDAMCHALWFQMFQDDWECDATMFESRTKRPKEQMQQAVRIFVKRQLAADAYINRFRKDEGIALGEIDVQEAQSRFIEGWFAQRGQVLDMMGQTPQDVFNVIGNNPELRARLNQDAMRKKVLNRMFKRYKEKVKGSVTKVSLAELVAKCDKLQREVQNLLMPSAETSNEIANNSGVKSDKSGAKKGVADGVAEKKKSTNKPASDKSNDQS